MVRRGEGGAARRGSARGGAAALLAAVAAAAALALAPSEGRAQTISPGELARPHERLEGITSCTSCHEVGAGVTDAKCLACHGEIATRVSAGKGYHAAVARRGEACASCHQDHAGRDFKLVAWPGGAREKFPHEETGFPLDGAHGKLECAKCHAPSRVRDEKLRGRAETYLGVAPECASCHEDPHRDSLGADCARCHEVAAWRPAPRFDHARTRFPLAGAHGTLACEACHERAARAEGAATPARPAPAGGSAGRAGAPAVPATPGSSAARERVFAVEGAASCTACHADRHAGRMGADCRSCHDERAWKPAAYAAARHERFPLEAAHAKPDCAACHGERLDRPLAGASCASCHEDALHRGSLGSRCERCHGTDAFTPARYDRATHAPALLPLAGRHAEARCEACHLDLAAGGKLRPRPALPAPTPAPAPAPAPPPLPLDATLPPASCASCHADVHAGRLGADCARCHAPEAWGPVAPFDARAHHATRYPLEGKHASLPCERCHGLRPTPSPTPTPAPTPSPAPAPSPTPAPSPSPAPAPAPAPPTAPPPSPSSAPRLLLLSPLAHDRCSDCHADAHKGELLRRPDGGACESCHTTGGFTPARFERADHARTAFALEGAHAPLACARCHGGPGLAAAPAPLAPSHTPPTPGAKAPASVPGRAAPAPPPASPAGVAQTAAVRLHPSGRCADCHQDPHLGQFGRPAAEGRCESCHGVERFRPPLPFDHAKTSFPLSGKHAALECARCHPAPPPGGSAPLAAAACTTCHKDPHLGQFSRRGDPEPLACDDCHGDGSFRPADRFSHAEHTRFPLDGRHAALPCERCHGVVALAPGLATRLYRPVPLECAGCHVDPHAGRRWTAEADAPAAAAPAAEPPAPPTHPPSASRDCARCHVTAAWERLRPGVAGFDHRRTGFPLRGAHAALLCDRCHAGSATSGEAAARGGGASARGAARAACASCHADPHRGEQGTSCEQCHSERSFRAEDGLTRHRATRFPLTGAHASAECGACHLERASGRFTPLPTECGACHLRDYLATTNPNHAATGFSTRCEECHRPTVWSAAKVYHDRFFPLTGAHAAVACASCHPGGRYAGTPRDCFGCHAADYGAAANPNHAQSGFGTDCQSCHGESSWRPATFDHERFFPLRSGPHSRFRNDCNACHPQPSNRSVFTCTTCHQRNDTDREHRNEPGYRYADADCYRCHPQGRH